MTVLALYHGDKPACAVDWFEVGTMGGFATPYFNAQGKCGQQSAVVCRIGFVNHAQLTCDECRKPLEQEQFVRDARAASGKPLR